MIDGDYVDFGICWCCDETIPLNGSGCCEECARKLDKERETGRCSWCGNFVMECDCE